MKNKYLVKVVRTGRVSVEADDEIQALDIANDLVQIKADSVCWSDDLEVSDAIEDDSALDKETPSVLIDPFEHGICAKCEYRHFVTEYYSDTIEQFCHAYYLPCSCKHKCEMYERKRW